MAKHSKSRSSARWLIALVACVFPAGCWQSEIDLISKFETANPFPGSTKLIVEASSAGQPNEEYLLERDFSTFDNTFAMGVPGQPSVPIKFYEIEDAFFLIGQTKYLLSIKLGDGSDNSDGYAYVLISRSGCCNWTRWQWTSNPGSDFQVTSLPDLVERTKKAVRDKSLKKSDDYFDVRRASLDEANRVRAETIERVEAEERAKAEERRKKAAVAALARKRAAEAAAAAASAAAAVADYAPSPAQMRQAIQSSSLGIDIDSVQKLGCQKERAYTYICNYRVKARLRSDDSISQLLSGLTGIGTNRGRFWKVGNSWMFKRI